MRKYIESYDTNGPGLPDFKEDINIDKAVVYMHHSYMLCSHNQACHVCLNAHAVYVMPTGIFEPCWECQKKGYKLIKEDPQSSIARITKWIKKNV